MMRARRIAAALPLALLVPLTAARHAEAPGYSYTFVTRVHTEGGRDAGDHVTMTGRATVSGDRARIDVDSAVSPDPRAPAPFANGTYFLTQDGGRRMILVSPSQRQYADFDLGAMAGALGALTGPNGLVHMQAKNVHMDVQNLGAGPRILGHPTTHYQRVQVIDLETKVLFKTMSSHDSSVTDAYIATDVPSFVAPFVDNGRAMAGSMSNLFGPEYAAQLQATVAKMPTNGIALRTVMTHVANNGGNARTSVSTSEITSLTSGNVDASKLEIPAGYTKVDMSGNAATSASAQQPSQPAAADSGNSRANAVKRGLRGIFGKPE